MFRKEISTFEVKNGTLEMGINLYWKTGNDEEKAIGSSVITAELPITRVNLMLLVKDAFDSLEAPRPILTDEDDVKSFVRGYNDGRP